MTTIALLRPFDKIKSFSICLLASFLIGIFGSVKLYVPFTPIAFVSQMQIIFILALFLGARKASFATILFLLQGLMHLPVLPSATSFTLALGYYLAYPLAAYFIGTIAERKRTYLNAFFAMTIANYLIIYVLGALVLSHYVGIKNAAILGMLPFYIPDLIKNLMIIKLLKSLNWEKK